MNLFSSAWTIFKKDLRVEMRSKEIVTSTALFAVLVVLLSAFAFDLNKLPGRLVSAGVLWIAVAFSGILALGRTFQREREMSVFSAVLMSPAPRAAIYLGKLWGIVVFLLAVQLILVPLIELFFHAPMIESLPALLPIMLLGTVGYASVGVLFAAMTVRTRLRDLLLGVILFPLVAPVLIAAVKATGVVLSGQPLSEAADYVKLLVIMDLIFFVGGLWLFGPLMED